MQKSFLILFTLLMVASLFTSCDSGNDNEIPCAELRYRSAELSSNNPQMRTSAVSDETEGVGIGDIIAYERIPVAYYSTTCIHLDSEPESGVFFILYGDGSIEKVVK